MIFLVNNKIVNLTRLLVLGLILGSCNNLTIDDSDGSETNYLKGVPSGWKCKKMEEYGSLGRFLGDNVVCQEKRNSPVFLVRKRGFNPRHSVIFPSWECLLAIKKDSDGNYYSVVEGLNQSWNEERPYIRGYVKDGYPVGVWEGVDESNSDGTLIQESEPYPTLNEEITNRIDDCNQYAINSEEGKDYRD